jgi:anti-sigma factor (TIGR02949 family)
MSETQGPGASSGSSHGRVDCTEALSRLFEFLDAEIDETSGDRIREHLADCEPCLREFDIEDHLKKLVRRSCSESAPAELHVRIRQQIVVMQARSASQGPIDPA